MGLFKEAGKKFEETKRSFVDGDDADDAEYVCRSCEERVASDYEYCPNCGEATVEPVE